MSMIDGTYFLRFALKFHHRIENRQQLAHAGRQSHLLFSPRGHQVRLIPSQYVLPSLKTNKHDAADAEAIAEALVRPTMRFAPIKSADLQAVLMLHHSRKLLVKPRTMLINAVRGHCCELKMTASQVASRVNDCLVMLETPDDSRLPTFTREALGVLMAQLHAVKEATCTLGRTLQTCLRSQEASQRLTTIPDVGVITAMALIATIGDGSQFKSGRHLSAWVGLVPRQHSSGGKSRLGRTSKGGNGNVRQLLVHKFRAVRRRQRAAPKRPSPWIGALLARGRTNAVLVARANKTARTVWAMLRNQQDFNAGLR